MEFPVSPTTVIVSVLTPSRCRYELYKTLQLLHMETKSLALR